MYEPVEFTQRLVVDLFLCVLATWQIVECWHHGDLFRRLLARIELVEAIWADLLLCPFCLSHWVALVTVVFMEAYRNRFSLPITGDWLFILGYIVLKAFAVTRLANVANDLCALFTRTPNRKDHPAE